MTAKEKNQQVYVLACEYLHNMLPDSLNKASLERYYVGDQRDFETIEDVYEQMIHSTQNYRGMPNSIKFGERKGEIKEVLYNYDFVKISESSPEDLYKIFREKYNVTSEDTPHNSWLKWSKSVVTAAKFLSEFESVSDFKKFVELFSYNVPTRMALPLLISTKISGMGFALACDFLKELGYLNYPKPDVHIKEICCELGLAEKTDIDVFEAMVKISDDCMEVDSTATPYKIDKIFWLICSGNFYLDGITTKRNKRDFIENTKVTLAIS